MTPTKPYRKQSIIDSFWVVTLINAQILCKTSKLGNKGEVPTMGGRSGGGGGSGEVSSGWGGGAPTVTVTFFLTLSAVVKRRMMKNPP